MFKKYQYSLIILFIFDMVVTYYQPDQGGIIKVIINLYIYASLLLIPFSNVQFYDKYFYGKSKIVYYLLIMYGVFTVVRNTTNGEMLSLLGNPFYGPVFFVPLFIFWVSKINSLFWLHRISMFAVKVGIFLTPLAFFFKINVANITFFPTFYLLLNYKYAPNKDKIWIILSYIFGLFTFYINDLRSGIIRIILCLVVFIIIQLNLKKVYRYFAVALITFPIYTLYIQITSDRNILSEILSFSNSEFIKSDELTDDTRTFLYVELLSDLEETNSLIFGKGAMGTYYSQYFYDNEGDNFIRHNVEVGVLSYLLKGGIVYLLLIFTIIILAIYNGIKYSKNRYIISLSLILSTFLFYSFIENIPSYSFYFSSVWIIVGICLSRRFVLLDDSQIENLIRYKDLTYSQDKKQVPFNNYPK